MLLIGHTNSDRKLHFQTLTEEMIRAFTPEDIFDAYCLMEHMVTHFILNADERKQEAQEFSADYKNHLIDFSLWEKLIKGRDATIPLHFAKLGKDLALLEFK
jgi:hypothetical protein